jgi:putative Mg2+ transporter-C (MgtC) family protein
MPLELQLDVCLRITVAAILSAIVGYDRERHDHPAGLRTHILVGLGSALFTALSLLAFGAGDKGRVAAQIVTGIGFLGAGAIIQGRRPNSIHGMTTAAGIWAVAALGMACGSGNYLIAAVSTILIWFILAILGRIEKASFPSRDHVKEDGEEMVPAGPPKRNSPQEPRERRRKAE